MLKAATTSTRAPRGTKQVAQAFFLALDAIPELSRTAVAKAAQVQIRDELKTRREKIKAAAAKLKTRPRDAAPKAAPAAPAKRTPKAAVKPPEPVAPAKRRTRKTPEVPVVA